LNNRQIKLVQMAVRAAGLRTKNADGRYRLLLGQYKQPGGQAVTSCKQLNNWQLEDLLAICEAHGWRCPGKEPDHFRTKVAACRFNGDVASFAQQSAIEKLAGDLGWSDLQLGGMIERMTGGTKDSVAGLTPSQAYKLIEALKAMFSREKGKELKTLRDVQKEVARDGEDKSRQIK